MKLAERQDLAILAVQGPKAQQLIGDVVDDPRRQVIDSLKVFQGKWYEDWFIARTGYTGERGFEIMLPGEAARNLWQQLVAVGVNPIGLGARDTLRLEAGMNLYGNDMDETVSPLESNMAGTVVLGERNFIGAKAIREEISRGEGKLLVGLVLHEKGVLRAHYPVFRGGQLVGEITSGAYSPTLSKSIAMARVTATGGDFSVEIRGRAVPVELVHPPFVRNGKQVYKAWQAD